MEIVLSLTYFSFFVCDISMRDFFDFILFVLKRISIQFHLELRRKHCVWKCRDSIVVTEQKILRFQHASIDCGTETYAPNSWWWLSKCNVFDVQSTLKCSYSNISFSGFPSKMGLIDNTHSQCVHNIGNPSLFIKIIRTQIHQKYSKYNIRWSLLCEHYFVHFRIFWHFDTQHFEKSYHTFTLSLRTNSHACVFIWFSTNNSCNRVHIQRYNNNFKINHIHCIEILCWKVMNVKLCYKPTKGMDIRAWIYDLHELKWNEMNGRNLGMLYDSYHICVFVARETSQQNFTTINNSPQAMNMTCLSLQVIAILARCADLLLSSPPKRKQKDFNEYAGCCAVCAAQFVLKIGLNLICGIPCSWCYALFWFIETWNHDKDFAGISQMGVGVTAATKRDWPKNPHWNADNEYVVYKHFCMISIDWCNNNN